MGKGEGNGNGDRDKGPLYTPALSCDRGVLEEGHLRERIEWSYLCIHGSHLVKGHRYGKARLCNQICVVLRVHRVYVAEGAAWFVSHTDATYADDGPCTDRIQILLPLVCMSAAIKGRTY